MTAPLANQKHLAPLIGRRRAPDDDLAARVPAGHGDQLLAANVFAGRHALEIPLDPLGALAVEAHRAVVDPDHPAARALDVLHVVRNDDDRRMRVPEAVEPSAALAPKAFVADG